MGAYTERVWENHLFFEKDPSDVVSYDINFTREIDTDTISTLTVTGDDITIDSSSSSGQTVTVTVSGGNDNSTGTVKVNMITSGSLTVERSFDVRIKNM